MAFRPEEVSSIIQKEIEGFQASLETESVGTILQVGDGIARIWGLQDAMAGELLEFPGGIMGMVLNLEQDNVGAALFGPDTAIKEGDSVKRTGKVAQVPAGDALLGRVVELARVSPSTARGRSPRTISGSSNPSRRTSSSASR